MDIQEAIRLDRMAIPCKGNFVRYNQPQRVRTGE